eukprot:279202-Chlamydomonas_euryale.AAC.1
MGWGFWVPPAGSPDSWPASSSCPPAPPLPRGRARTDAARSRTHPTCARAVWCTRHITHLSGTYRVALNGERYPPFTVHRPPVDR